MNGRKIIAIFNKQLKDTFKNHTILIQFIMFPLLALIMENTISTSEIPKNYFVILFSTMYIGMAPLISMASILAEEKEDHTLRVLMMSNVKAGEYLIGVGMYVFSLCMLGTIAFGVIGNFKGKLFLEFILIIAVGIFISILLGSVIGVWSKNQMAATSITVPVMMIFSFLPMISMFNDKIKFVSRITYSQQINNFINSLGSQNIGFENIIVILLNIISMITLFILVYKRGKLI